MGAWSLRQNERIWAKGLSADIGILQVWRFDASEFDKGTRKD